MSQIQYITAKCQYRLPFEIPMLEGTMTKGIQFDFHGSQVTIYSPTFSDSVSGKIPALIRPTNNTYDFMERAFGYLGDKIIFKVNLIPMDIVKEFDDSIDLSETKAKKEMSAAFHGTAEAVLRRFLEVCRYRTGNTDIEYRTFHGISKFIYYKDGKHLPVFEGGGGYGHPVGNCIDEDNFNLISHDLVSGVKVPLPSNLLLNARQFSGLGNLRLAIIEAFTALDVALSSFLKTFISDCDVSISTFMNAMYKTWKLEAAFYHRLETAVTFLPSDIEDEIKESGLLNRCKNVIKLRNKIVHDGEDIPKGEFPVIKGYIDAIEKMIGYFDNQWSLGQVPRLRKL